MTVVKAQTILMLDIDKLPDNWQDTLKQYLKVVVDGTPIYIEPNCNGYITFQEATLMEL